MSYEFTKLSDVPAVAEFPEGANAIIETNGEIKRCPSSNTPKPLTYDYMPAGYPSKSVQTTTLMEEQELTFALMGDAGQYVANLTEAFEIVEGQTYTVSWDGTVYECVCSVLGSMLAFGNLSIVGAGNDTGEPFVYGYNTKQATGVFGTTETSASHTISVKKTGEIVTPMAEEFLPENLATKSDVAVVRTTAENARTAANDAKTTADNAQTAAENAQTMANDAKIAAENAIGADVVKGNYKLRVGEQKYVGYGFAILFNDSVRMNYTDTGIYDEYSGSILDMAGRSVFKSTQSSKKKIEIAMNADSDTGENSISLYRANGEYTSISADGSLFYSGAALKIGNLGSHKILRYVNTPEEEYDAATKGYVDGKISDTEIFLKSSTPDSTKKFKITVDDNGTISAAEVTT